MFETQIPIGQWANRAGGMVADGCDLIRSRDKHYDYLEAWPSQRRLARRPRILHTSGTEAAVCGA